MSLVLATFLARVFTPLGGLSVSLSMYPARYPPLLMTTSASVSPSEIVLNSPAWMSGQIDSFLNPS